MRSLQETADQLCQENHPAKQTVEVRLWSWVDLFLLWWHHNILCRHKTPTLHIKTPSGSESAVYLNEWCRLVCFPRGLFHTNTLISLWALMVAVGVRCVVYLDQMTLPSLTNPLLSPSLPFPPLHRPTVLPCRHSGSGCGSCVCVWSSTWKTTLPISRYALHLSLPSQPPTQTLTRTNTVILKEKARVN